MAGVVRLQQGLVVVDRTFFYWSTSHRKANNMQLICGHGFNTLCTVFILPTSIHLVMCLVDCLLMC